MVLNLQGTRLLTITEKFRHSDLKVLVFEGSSGSSKTFSLAQSHLMWSFLEEEKGKVYSVVRKTLPALKRSALRDFKSVIHQTETYRAFRENKTDLTFTNIASGTVIEFFALDNEQKARGPRRNRLWCNEANELNEDEYRQLAMRTKDQICMDYNPSMVSSWIYDDILTRDDCWHVHSTYKDNPFLTTENVTEIESMAPVYRMNDGSLSTDWDLSLDTTGLELMRGDPYWWSVYGLGLRGSPSESIYPYVHDSEGLDEDAEKVYGLDFGYNHSMVLVDVERRDAEGMMELHIDELLHESYLTIADLIEMLPALGVTMDQKIYADGSRPEAIEEIKREGYWIEPADKSKGSVYSGINFVKSHKLCFTKRSHRGKVQHMDYRWKKTVDGTIMDEPVKLNDDSPDAVRYAAYTHWGEAQPFILGVY